MKKQAAVTALSAAAVRGLGFIMRLIISRLLGPEAMGIMELAGSAHMLAVTPGAAGLPGAVSRLTAREKEGNRPLILMAGRQLALRTGLLLVPVFLLFSPLIARWLGDVRTLPSLWLMAPSVLFIGLSSVYDGYFYGSGNAWPPALSELSEQLIRFFTALPLLMLLPGLMPAWRAAAPALSTTLGEGVGLAVVVIMAGGMTVSKRDQRLPAIRSQLMRLSLPLMLSRLSHTLLRTLCGIVIPLRLVSGGLLQGEALSRLGMLSGMVMPLMFLPSLVTGALATVGGPAMAKCREKRKERRLAVRLMLPAAGFGLLCSAVLYALSPFIAVSFYKLPELTPLIRAMCPMALLFPLQQVAGGMMTGLGLQKKALIASLIGAAATLLCTWQWAAMPHLHIYGAGYASLMGHGLSLFAMLVFLISHLAGKE